MKRKSFIKTVVTNVAIAFFFSAIFVLIYYYLLEERMSSYINLINAAALKKVEDERATEVEYNFEQRRLINYPRFGKKYATLKIDKMNLKLPIYFGDTLKILRYGIGHYAGSFFPGENGTIVLAGHNTAGFFKKLDVLKPGDKVEIETTYGKFTYEVDSSKIVKETDLAAFPLQHDKEMLIMYTCYPMNHSVVGRRKKRYVVYAYKVGEVDEK